MARETERKFLVKNDSWRTGAKSARYVQGYVCADAAKTVRVRIVAEKGFLTVKIPVSEVTRLEFEYAIPKRDAREMLEKICEKSLVEKYRHKIEYKGFVWEVDEFSGANKGLVVAEIELTHEEEMFEKPEWLGREVTGEKKYYNACLARMPYCDW